MPKIKLTSIKCTVPDEIDKDEMFLKYKGEKIWPEDHKFFRVDVDDEERRAVTAEHACLQTVAEHHEGDVEAQPEQVERNQLAGAGA